MQCNKAAFEANKRLGMIKRKFRFKSRTVMLPIYKSIVRPHFDYFVQAWRPHCRNDIDKLEKVQRRATKMVDGLEEYSYSDRLRTLGLTTLDTRFLGAIHEVCHAILMIFDPPLPLSQTVTNCHKSWTPLKVCHTSEQKVNK